MILMIDNYDSFVFNLVRYFSELGHEIKVARNNKISLSDIYTLAPQQIVISPGPCSPTEAGISLDAIHEFKNKIPILGVCLGHQSIGQAFGGTVKKALKPIHGKTSQISHNQSGLFTECPSPLKVTRYHSLIVDKKTLPSDLIITSESEEGEIMALAHQTFPIAGVQFHPEAILTECGHKMLQNFMEGRYR
jgi:anthranilate synthase/aminodeoxychorismate synthase-like glutamine amidotransferase